MSLSTDQKLTFAASVGESLLGVLYVLLLIILAVTNLPALKTPFYYIFAVTGVAACLNLVVIISMRLGNQVFFLGPDFGTVTIAFTYLSHVFVFTHTILKAMQVINRFTSLYFPMKHETIWASKWLYLVLIGSFLLPVAIFLFMIIDQKALYVDVCGIWKFAGMEKTDLETAKIIIASVFLLFVIITLPLNILLLLKIRRIRSQNIFEEARLKSEWMFFYYVVAITAAHMIGVVHQIFWLIATATENKSLTFIALYTYAYPNFITTFTPPIALIIMSQHVREGIRNFMRCPKIQLNFNSTNTVKVSSTTHHQ